MCVSATAGDADVRLLATDQSFPVRRCKFFNKSGSTTRTCLQEKDLPPFTEESIYIRSGAHLYTCILLSSSLSLLPHRRRRCSASLLLPAYPFPFPTFASSSACCFFCSNFFPAHASLLFKFLFTLAVAAHGDTFASRVCHVVRRLASLNIYD